MQCLPVAREHLGRIFPSVQEHTILEAIPIAQAEEELRQLQSLGIELTVCGKLAAGNEPRIALSRPFKACQ
eukprot:1004446-Karenia_brevis.AAC.1